MANPDQIDFFANRIRYVQDQPHLQPPPAPETHQVHQATQVHQGNQVQHHQHQQPTSPEANLEREKIHQNHSCTRPKDHQTTKVHQQPTILQQSRKRMQVRWDDGSLQCLHTSSCWVQIRKNDERTFSL